MNKTYSPSRLMAIIIPVLLHTCFILENEIWNLKKYSHWSSMYFITTETYAVFFVKLFIVQYKCTNFRKKLIGFTVEFNLHISFHIHNAVLTVPFEGLLYFDVYVIGVYMPFIVFFIWPNSIYCYCYKTKYCNHELKLNWLLNVTFNTAIETQ